MTVLFEAGYRLAYTGFGGLLVTTGADAAGVSNPLLIQAAILVFTVGVLLAAVEAASTPQPPARLGRWW